LDIIVIELEGMRTEVLDIIVIELEGVVPESVLRLKSTVSRHLKVGERWVIG
jgi:hypothetical protein